MALNQNASARKILIFSAGLWAQPLLLSAIPDQHDPCMNDGFSRYLSVDLPFTPARAFRSNPGGNSSVNVPAEGTHPFRLSDEALSSGFSSSKDFPVLLNQEVREWVSHFTGRGRISFSEWLSRAAAVRKTLLPLLIREKLPPELFYLPMIESGFSHDVSSRASASGPWQFVPGTARLYGLTISFWRDERRDLLKSTVAATAYLKDLRVRFGDWYLALAAYNTGPGRVDSAIRKGNSRDFWTLSRQGYFNRETKNYVPKLLAAIIIARNPESYGFEVIPDPSFDVPLHSIVLRKAVSLPEVARYLGVPHEQVRMWNPELIHGISPHKNWCAGGYYALKLPESFIARFEMIEPLLSSALPSVVKTPQFQSQKITQIASSDSLESQS